MSHTTLRDYMKRSRGWRDGSELRVSNALAEAWGWTPGTHFRLTVPAPKDPTPWLAF